MFPATQKEEVCFIANVCNQQGKALIIHTINTEQSATPGSTSCEKVHQSMLQNYNVIVQVHKLALMLLSSLQWCREKKNPFQLEPLLDRAQILMPQRDYKQESCWGAQEEWNSKLQ